MVRWFAQRRSLNQSALAEAERLIAANGARAWEAIYDRCRGGQLCKAERAVAYRVRDIVERRLKMRWRIDAGSSFTQGGASHAP